MLPTSAVALAASLVAGCGAAISPSGSVPAGNTTVTLIAASTANDQITQFTVYFDAITLTSRSGKTVSLLPGYEHDEFIHLNGKAEPLSTTSVPDDTYVSASATIGPESFTCFGGNASGMVLESDYAYGYTPDSHVAVNLPVPVTVSGVSMVLSLDLQASQSATWTASACYSPLPGDKYLITPTFNLVTASPAQSAMSGLDGVVASVDEAGSSFSMTADGGPNPEVTTTGATVTSNGPVWQAITTSSTVFQGIPSLSALKSGMLVDMDAALQSDGSVLARRIAVYDTADTNTATLSASIGPIIGVYDAPKWMADNNRGPVLLAADTEVAGDFAATYGGWIGEAGFSSEGAAFQTSGQLSNLQKLPFAASFNATNAAAGQWIAATFNGTELSDSTPLTTVTLMPQTIDGTVTAVSSEGGFNTYTVSLAAYDLFPQLAVEADQITVLNDPATVTVYADSDTQMLNTAPITVGSVARFNGLIFNDSGTLRMDCAQITGGVTE
jgi:hypothetical protein